MKKKQKDIFGNEIIKVRTSHKPKKTGSQFYATDAVTPADIIKELEEKYDRRSFYALTSGGNDSLMTCHVLAEMNKLKKVVHIDTGTGIKATQDFVKDTCQSYGWPLQIIYPPFKYIYVAFCLEHGFPGAGVHKSIMAHLKYRAMRNFALSADPKNHCLVTGIRQFESERRKVNYNYPINRDNSVWFANPIFYKSQEDVYRYVRENGIKSNPVSKILGFSGECNCGAYAQRDEKLLIRRLDSHRADFIEWIEDGVNRFGTPKARKFAKWGNTPAMIDLKQQLDIDGEPISDMQELLSCRVECGAGTMRGTIDY